MHLDNWHPLCLVHIGYKMKWKKWNYCKFKDLFCAAWNEKNLIKHCKSFCLCCLFKCDVLDKSINKYLLCSHKCLCVHRYFTLKGHVPVGKNVSIESWCKGSKQYASNWCMSRWRKPESMYQKHKYWSFDMMLVGFENDSKRSNEWMNEWMNGGMNEWTVFSSSSVIFLADKMIRSWRKPLNTCQKIYILIKNFGHWSLN